MRIMDEGIRRDRRIVVMAPCAVASGTLGDRTGASRTRRQRLSIYWASPVHQHRSIPPLAARSTWRIWHLDLDLLPGTAADPGAWLYDHFGLGDVSSGASAAIALAARLPLHDGRTPLRDRLVLGGGFKHCCRGAPTSGCFAMLRYYLGVPKQATAAPVAHPPVTSKYNPLQRIAYLAMPLLGVLAVASGWAMHKPVQLKWLERPLRELRGGTRHSFLDDGSIRHLS